MLVTLPGKEKPQTTNNPPPNLKRSSDYNLKKIHLHLSLQYKIRKAIKEVKQQTQEIVSRFTEKWHSFTSTDLVISDCERDNIFQPLPYLPGMQKSPGVNGRKCGSL